MSNRTTLRSALVALVVLTVTPAIAPAWPTDVVVTSSPGLQAEPEIVSDGAGGAIVFWRDYASANVPVYARRVRASGTADPAWPAQGLMVFENGSMLSASLVADGAGGAFVGWQSGSHGVRVHHVASNGTFDPAWPVGGRVVRSVTAPDLVYEPSLLSDGAGGVLVAWQEQASSIPAIRVRRLNGAGVFDPAWPATGVLVSHDVAGGFSMVPDQQAGAVVVWRRPSGSQGAAQRVRANGTLDPSWPAAGRAFGQPGNGASILAVPDEAGGVLVLWTLNVEGVTRAQHILDDGYLDPAWPLAGVAFGQGGWWSAAVGDGAGGLISAWLNMPDPENNNAYYVYGQRVLGGGTQDPQWPAGELYVANTDSDSPASPRAVSDGAGGAIVAFEGYRFFALIHVLASGAVDPAWPANGRRLSADASDIPALVLADAGGVIVAWRGPFSAESDIYAQRLAISGTVDVPRPLLDSELRLTRIAPTPTRGSCAIDFSLPTGGRVALAIHDVGGRKICDVLAGDLTAGPHTVSWDGTAAGRRVPNGIYFLRLATTGSSRMGRLVIMR